MTRAVLRGLLDILCLIFVRACFVHVDWFCRFDLGKDLCMRHFEMYICLCKFWSSGDHPVWLSVVKIWLLTNDLLWFVVCMLNTSSWRQIESNDNNSPLPSLPVCVWMSVCVCVCVCEWVSVCVHVQIWCVNECVCVCECVCEWVSVCVHVQIWCVNECVCVSVCVSEWVCLYMCRYGVWMSVCVSEWVCVYMCRYGVWMSVCVCVCECVSEWVCLYMCRYGVWMSVCVSVSEWVCEWVTVCECVCEWVSVCVWVSVSVCVWVSECVCVWVSECVCTCADMVCEWVCMCVWVSVWVCVYLCGYGVWGTYTLLWLYDDYFWSFNVNIVLLILESAGGVLTLVHEIQCCRNDRCHIFITLRIPGVEDHHRSVSAQVWEGPHQGRDLRQLRQGQQPAAQCVFRHDHQVKHTRVLFLCFLALCCQGQQPAAQRVLQHGHQVMCSGSFSLSLDLSLFVSLLTLFLPRNSEWVTSKQSDQGPFSLFCLLVPLLTLSLPALFSILALKMSYFQAKWTGSFCCCCFSVCVTAHVFSATEFWVSQWVTSKRIEQGPFS